MYIEILDNFFILSIKNWFVDEVIFQNDDSSYRTKGVKDFFQIRHLKTMDSSDLNLIENLR